MGSLSWLISEVVFRTHVPGWTAVLGWSLLFSNSFALPLMNLGGLILEEAPGRDLQGVVGALVLSFALVPFQGWAALKGLLSKHEGPWFRTPKTGRITDEVHHLRRLRLLRQWLLGAREPRLRPLAAQATIRPAQRWTSSKARRRTGWVVAVAMAVAIGALVWGSSRAPVSEAAGNPLYLHGTGVAPAFVAGSMNQTAGAQTTACELQSGSPAAIFGFTNLPAQTIAAGTWSFTMYWTGGDGNTSDTVTLAAGVTSLPTCAGFTTTIQSTGTWTTTYGLSGANTASPFTVSTSASQPQLTIPAGGSLCLEVTLTHHSGGKPFMVYDGPSGVASTQLVPPSTVVPENVLPLAGLALAIPLFTGRRRLAALLRRVTR